MAIKIVEKKDVNLEDKENYIREVKRFLRQNTKGFNLSDFQEKDKRTLSFRSSAYMSENPIGIEVTRWDNNVYFDLGFVYDRSFAPFRKEIRNSTGKYGYACIIENGKIVPNSANKGGRDYYKF